jgi:hypothetical protein
LSSGRDSKAESQQYFDDSNKMLSAASLHLKSWGFSDASLDAKATASCISDSTKTSKVLAFLWNRELDPLELQQLSLAPFCTEKATKRDVLR